MEQGTVYSYEAKTAETPKRDLETILKDYRVLAAKLGQLEYETQIKKDDMIKKMIELNQEAIALEPTNEKN
jgi:hypothetical protein